MNVCPTCGNAALLAEATFRLPGTNCDEIAVARWDCPKCGPVTASRLADAKARCLRCGSSNAWISGETVACMDCTERQPMANDPKTDTCPQCEGPAARTVRRVESPDGAARVEAVLWDCPKCGVVKTIRLPEGPGPEVEIFQKSGALH